MSNLNENDIAEYQENQLDNIKNTWQVEEIEAISFDENGDEDGTWKGYCVTLIDDPANYCFDCRDELNANKLCDFLNDECDIKDTSVDDFVIDNCIEWDKLISELSKKEIKLMKYKKEYSDKEFEIVYTSDIDFKALYGSTAEKVRKQHAANTLKVLDNKIKSLELSIDYLKRRISYLKALVSVKTALIGAKKSE